jgi:hypothetical protein
MDLKDFRTAIITSTEQLSLLQAVNEGYEFLAEHIFAEVAPSPQRTIALHRLLESKMNLVHGITHPPQYLAPVDVLKPRRDANYEFGELRKSAEYSKNESR